MHSAYGINHLLSELRRALPISALREYGLLCPAQESHGGGAAPLGFNFLTKRDF